MIAALALAAAIAVPATIIALIDRQLSRQARHDGAAHDADEHDRAVALSEYVDVSPFHNQWSNS